ncbi:MAG: hypothetical protein V1692_02200 [bacterium]
MKLSKLQNYILTQSFLEAASYNRDKLLKFYDSYKKPPIKEDQINIITKSLERLINQGLLVGYGIRTNRKWFIKEIKITGQGKQLAKKLLSQQQILPLKKRKVKN